MTTHDRANCAECRAHDAHIAVIRGVRRPAPRRDDLDPTVDLFLVVEPGGGWPYATTDRAKAFERRTWHGGHVGRVPVLMVPETGSDGRSRSGHPIPPTHGADVGSGDPGGPGDVSRDEPDPYGGPIFQAILNALVHLKMSNQPWTAIPLIEALEPVVERCVAEERKWTLLWAADEVGRIQGRTPTILAAHLRLCADEDRANPNWAANWNEAGDE